MDLLTDDRVRIIADFIASHIDREGVEIEAKIGYYTFKNHGTEYLKRRPPVYRHITLINGDAATFTSEVPANIFHCVKESILKKAGYSSHTLISILDNIYSAKNRNEKFRESLLKSGESLGCIMKKRVEDLNFIVHANSGLGFRLSANVEEKLERIPEDSRRVFQRDKTRESFSLENFRYDLTSVAARKGKTHEIELEMLNVRQMKYFTELYRDGLDRELLLNVANELWGKLLKLLDLRPRSWVECVEEEPEYRTKRIEEYSKCWGDTQPVIGDYLFEVAKEIKTNT